MDVKIVPGIIIGDGAVVGLGTVVSIDVAPLTVVGSTPPVLIKLRDHDLYNALDRRRSHGGVNGEIYSPRK